MNKEIDCEALIIGSGAGGSVAFSELAKEGYDTLMVEEGSKWEPSQFDKPIHELTQMLYRDGGLTPFLGNPAIGFGEGVALGGSTVVNGGLLWRTPEFILSEWSEKNKISGYSMKDLSPYFDRIENTLNVSNELDIDEHDLDSKLIEQSAIDLGWKVVPVPRATINCSRRNQCGAGCPSGAKQSVDKNYIKFGIGNGGRVLTQIKIENIVSKKGIAKYAKGYDIISGERVIIRFKSCFIAAGAIGTPLILKKSNLSKTAGRKLQFHINLKVFASFPHAINSEKGTMFTRQIQEFESEGILIMGTNFNKPYLATSLAHLDSDRFNRYFEMYNHSAVYTPMIKPSGTAMIHRILNDKIIQHKLDPIEDLEKLRRALHLTSKLLFNAGAQEVILPFSGSNSIKKFSDAENMIQQAKISQYQLLSVHAMSSCSMGIADKQVCDINGRVRGTKNLFICDASVLPSNIGESPQGTIMAFSHAIMDRYLNSYKIH